MSRICRKCGIVNNNEQIFCRGCGYHLVDIKNKQETVIVKNSEHSSLIIDFFKIFSLLFIVYILVAIIYI